LDFYLIAPDGQRLTFPANPEQIRAATGAKMQAVEVLDLGSLEFPRGKVPARISWDGFFPGAGRRNQSYVKAWRAPQELVAILTTWRDTGTKLRLLVTETPLNIDVYLVTFEHTWGGGFGDCHYRLEFGQARELKVLTDTEWQAYGGQATLHGQTAAATRPAPPTPSTYTVVDGDNLWGISKRFLGDGSRWRQLYEANRAVVGSDPDLILPGQVLQIPAGGVAG
jgi:hypothetical protein